MKHLTDQYKNEILRTRCAKDIEFFNNLLSTDSDGLFHTLIDYNMDVFKIYTPETLSAIMADLSFVDGLINDTPQEFESVEDADYNFVGLVQALTACFTDKEVEDIENTDYRLTMPRVPFISMALYKHYPEYYIPYMFMQKFNTLLEFCDKYQIPLPPTYARSKYELRTLYYIDINHALQEFRRENDLTPAELCAMLYMLEPMLMQEYRDMPQTDIHNNVWFIGGTKRDLEDVSNTMLWQANPDTKRGDILVFYEKAPVKAVNAVWIAQQDAYVDPFGFYYSLTKIGDKIDVPAVYLNELIADQHFANFPLVKKNMQGVNGWAIGADDYDRLKVLWSLRGCDVTTLPTLFEFSPSRGLNIHLEKEVEDEMIVAWLEDMGITPDMYIRQQKVQAGHNKIRPDFSIFPFGETDAKVIIETKRAKSNKLYDTFDQANSYAVLQRAQLLLIIDEKSIYAYQRVNDYFTRSRYTQFDMREVENTNSDTFKTLKSLIFATRNN